MRYLGALVLLSVLGAVRAAASCQDSPGNLLAPHNCGFDKEASGWTAVSGASLSRNPAEHGVLEAAADPSGSLTINGPCLPARAATEYHFGARLRSTAGTAYFCSFNVFQYSDDQCSEAEEPLGSAPGPPGPTWAAVQGSATTSGATRSVRVRPVCSGQPRFVVQFDDFVLAET
jgi:hypothetical protein